MLYGIGRISTGKQNIERQVRNILAKYPNARIIKETYTKEISSENKYGKLAKELFYKQVIKDRRVLYD